MSHYGDYFRAMRRKEQESQTTVAGSDRRFNLAEIDAEIKQNSARYDRLAELARQTVEQDRRTSGSGARVQDSETAAKREQARRDYTARTTGQSGARIVSPYLAGGAASPATAADAALPYAARGYTQVAEKPKATISPEADAMLRALAGIGLDRAFTPKSMGEFHFGENAISNQMRALAEQEEPWTDEQKKRAQTFINGWYTDVSEKERAENQEIYNALQRRSKGRVAQGVNAAMNGLVGGLESAWETGKTAIPNALKWAGEQWDAPLDQQQSWQSSAYSKAAMNMDSAAARDLELAGLYQQEAARGLSPAGRFVANNLISVGQNIPTMALSAVPVVGSALSMATMGASAGGSRAYELQRQGAGAGEAFLRGAAAGGIEALTEKFSIENFWDIAQGVGAKTAVKNILRQMGVEASEESASYVLNYIADKAAKDPNAEFSLAELAESAAGGAFSGGIFGSAGVLLNALGENGRKNYAYLWEQDGGKTPGFDQQYQTYYKLGRAGIAPTDASAPMQYGAQSAGYNDGAAEAPALAERLRNGETMTDSEVDTMLAYPESRKALADMTGGLPESQVQAREAVREWQRKAQKAAENADAAAQSNPELSNLRENELLKSDVSRNTETGENVSPGLVRESTPAHLDATTAETIDRIAKKTGVSVAFSDTMAANGAYRNGAITIRSDAENPVRQVFVHELTHHLETSGDYQAFANMIEKHINAQSAFSAAEQMAMISQEYAANGDFLTEDGARREMIAKFAEEHLFTDERSIQRLAQEDRTLTQKIRDWLRDLAAKLRGTAEQRFILKAERMYAKALEGAEVRETGEEQHLFIRSSDSQRAEQMEQSGADRDAIWKETGLIRDTKGNWVREIDDSGMKYDRYGFQDLRRDERFRRLEALEEKMDTNAGDLGLSKSEYAEWEALSAEFEEQVWSDHILMKDFIQHDELFDQYPKLKNVELVFEPMEAGVRGYYDYKMGAIHLNDIFKDSPESTILHEIQHVIQRWEGRPNGASPAYWQERIDRGEVFTKNSRAIAEADAKYESLFESAPETLQNKIRELNRAYLAGDSDTVKQIAEELYAGKYADLYGEIDMADFERRMLRENDTTMTAVEAYSDTAGEIEARETQNRARMPSGERRKKTPDLGWDRAMFADGSAIAKEVFNDAGTSDRMGAVALLRENLKTLETMDTVATLTGMELPKEGKATDRAMAFVSQFGGKVMRNGFGEVLFSKSRIKGSLLGHGFGEAKIELLAGVPSVIQNGVQIGFESNWKGRGYDSYVFAAPVEYRGEQAYLTAIVVKDRISNRYYLHEAVDQNGNLLYGIEKSSDTASDRPPMQSGDTVAESELGKGEKIAPSTGTSQNGGLTGGAVSPLSDTIISDSAQNGKKNSGGQKSQGASLSEINERLAKMTEQERAELVRENKRQREKIAELRRQMKRTPPGKRSESAVRRIASEFLSDYDSKADKADISGRLQKLYDGMSAGGESALSANLYRDAADVARDIVLQSESLNDEAARQYRGMTDYIRKTKITLDGADRASLTDGYDNFRKANMGRMKIGEGGIPVDAMYHQLQNDYGEVFFPEEITHPADRLERISEVLDSLAPVYENRYANTIGDAAHYLAMDIIARGAEVEAAKPTFADRQEARLERAVTAERERAQKALARERARREKQVNDLKAHYQEVNKRRRNRTAESRAQERLLKLARRLDNLKTTPVNRAKIAELVGELDTMRRGMTAQGRMDLTELRAQYEDARKNDPNWMPDPKLEERISRLDKTQIAEMTIEDVQTLTNAMQALEHQIRNENKLIRTEDRRDVYAQAQEAVHSIENAQGAKKGWKDKYISAMLSPERAVRRMVGYDENSPLYRVTKGLSDGQRSSQRFQYRAEKFFEKWTTNRAFMDSLTGAKAKRVQITGYTSDGKAVQLGITPAMRISLYLHTLNDDNLRHITEGGLTIPDAKLYEQGDLQEAYARGVTVRLSPSDARHIAAQMTSKERAYALAVHQFLNGETKTAINETSLALDGYEKATVENYFPIRTDSDFTRTTFEGLKHDATVEGMGMLKERQRASNPILLEDVTNVLDRQIQNTALYYGMAIPVRNFNKLMNVTGAGNSFSVKDAISSKWGTTATDYLNHMLTDAQGGRKSGNDFIGKAMNRLRSNYAGAVLTLNPSVTMKQVASYPTAAGVIGWKPLIQAFQNTVFHVDNDLIAKYTPLYWYRSKGFSTTELGDITRRSGHLPKALNWIQASDLATTKKLWIASEYYVRDHYKALEVKSDAYYKQVAEVYNRVIEESQPNYTVMQRPDILRTTNELTKTMTMFTTQRFQNFNMLYDAYGNLRAKQRAYALDKSDGNKNALKEAHQNFNRNVQAQAVAAGVISGMTFAAAFALNRLKNYKDDDDEMTAASVLTQMGKDFVNTLTGSLLGGTELTGIVNSLAFGETWYDMETSGLSSINDAVSSVKAVLTASQDFWAAAESDSEEIAPKKAQSLALKGKRLMESIAKLVGVPLENVNKIGYGAASRATRTAAGEFVGEYYNLLLSTDADSDSGKYLDLLYKAYRNGSEDFETLRELMLDIGITEKQIEMGFASRQKQTEDYQTAYSGTSDSLLNDLSANGLYQQNAERAQDFIDDYAKERAKAASDDQYVVDGRWNQAIENAESVGLRESDVILYRLALEVADADHNSSISQSEAEDALGMISGLNDRQRAYLWQATNKGWKNPYE